MQEFLLLCDGEIQHILLIIHELVNKFFDFFFLGWDVSQEKTFDFVADPNHDPEIFKQIFF